MPGASRDRTGVVAAITNQVLLLRLALRVDEDVKDKPANAWWNSEIVI